jgi:hypothetical protein
MKPRSIRCTLLCAALAVLVSSLAWGVGTGGTGLRVAYVRGMMAASGGGIAVNGVDFDSSSARVTINGVRVRGVDDLRDGMVAGVDGGVDGTGTRGIAQSIDVNRMVLGSAFRVGTGGTGLYVANLYIAAGTGVVYDGLGSLSDVAPGDWLDVYGYGDGVSGTVHATRIERVTPAGAAEIHGTITLLDTASMVVNGVTVDTHAAVFSGFDPAPAVGDRVVVVGTATTNGFVAATVVPETDSVRENAEEAEVEDAVEAVIDAGHFVVAGLEVDATQATYAGGTAADLAVGRVVHVDGSIVKGVLVASDVEFDSEFDEGEVEGTISAVVSATTFVVHGVTVDASTAHLSGGNVSDIQVGRKVEAEGKKDKKSGVLRAAKVEFDDSHGGKTPPSSGSQVKGKVSALADPGLFWVGSQLVDARTAKITGGTAASIQPGVRVQATGALSNGIFVATKVKIGGGD